MVNEEEKLKVFLSCSGELSNSIARIFNMWLPGVLNVNTFFAEDDIAMSKPWHEVINKELAEASFSIIFVTPENITSQWMLRERDAQNEKLRSNVYTILFNQPTTELPIALTPFQNIEYSKKGVLRLLKMLNDKLGNKSLPVQQLDFIFENKWVILDERIRHLMDLSKNKDTKSEDKTGIKKSENIEFDDYGNVIPSQLISDLTNRKLVISTVGTDEIEKVNELMKYERLPWQVGPPMQTGDLLLIYISKSIIKNFFGHSKLGQLKSDGLHLIFVAADKSKPLDKKSKRNYEVTIHNRLIINNPISKEMLMQNEVLGKWGPAKMNFRSVGQKIQFVDKNIAEELWRLILEENPDLMPGLYEIVDRESVTLSPLEDEEKSLSFYMVNKAVSDFWTVEDLLGYETYARAIAQPILDGTTRPPLTIAVQAPWGHGKTSLMRMIQKLLEEKEPSNKSEDSNTDRLRFNQLFSYLDQEEEIEKEVEEKKKEESGNMLKLDGKYIPTVWFNPLYYQNSEQIWAGMAHAILNQLSDKMKSPLKSEEFWLRLQWKRLNSHAIRKDFHKMIFEGFIPKAVCYLIAGIITAAIVGIYAIKNTTTGLIWSASGGIPIVISFIHYFIDTKFAEKWTLRDKFKTYVQEPDYEGKLGYLHLVDSDIDKALQLLAGKHTIAVFVDDLDRCRPDVVCEIIMAINQFISLPNRNIIFILGMDSKKVAEALETSLDHKESNSVPPTNHEKSFGWHFLEKFIQLPFFIPHLSKEIITSYLETLLIHSKSQGEKRTPDTNKINNYKKRIKDSTDVEGLITIAQEIKSEVPSEENKEIERELSSKASKLLKDPEGEELKRLAETAIEDQEYNPRAVKRFLNLVRFLRQIQLVRGIGDVSESSRLIITRTAHLILNWPEILLWLQGHESQRTKDGEKIVPIEMLVNIAIEANTFNDWSLEVHNTWGKERARILANPGFYEFMRRTTEKPPSLLDIYNSKQL
jgi:hypothetical protein